MSKTTYLLAVALVVAGGISAYVICRPKPPMYCINNLRAIELETPSAQAERLRMEQQVLTRVPLGAAFSNAVSALGTNYITITNTDGSSSINFHFKLPNITNEAYKCYITLNIESNAVMGIDHRGIKFQSH